VEPLRRRECLHQIAEPAGERTAKDSAIEHAEYMAQAAERLLSAINTHNAQRDEDGDAFDEAELAQAEEAVSEAFRAMRSGIHEFRKRRDRAMRAQAAPAAPDRAMTDTTSAAPILLPCPFCGANASGYAIDAHEHSAPLKALGIPDHQGSYVIEGDCQCGSGLIGYTQEEVTARWNRRIPAVTPSDAEIDAQWRESVAKHETTAAFVRDFARAVLARWGAPQPVARVPLTDEQIRALWFAAAPTSDGRPASWNYARAIERAHGIGIGNGERHG